MIDDFMTRALLGGIAIALVCAPLGCFVVWRRMAYFGDTLSHSALLGIALGFMLHWHLQVSVLLVCIAIALLLIALQGRKNLASDTLLGIMAHSSLALGMIVVTFVHGVRIDLLGLLFGDILAVSKLDLLLIYSGGIVILALVFLFWNKLLMMTLHEDLAFVEGVNIRAMRLLLVLMLAVVIAIAMKIVGVLLITSLLIIPAASARLFAKSPEQMRNLACVIGVVAVVGGLFASLQWDIPAGPAIVVFATGVMILGQFATLLFRK